MSKFYITYGVAGYPKQPYNGGHSIIYAKTEEEARNLHQAKYGLSPDGFLRFCSSYTAERFAVDSKKYNLGKCWDIIGQPTAEEVDAMSEEERALWIEEVDHE